MTVWWISLISHWNNEGKSNLHLKWILKWEKNIYFLMRDLINKTTCAKMIAAPAFNTFYNLF